MGATATPLAMIYLGGVFACIDVLSFVKKPDYYGITLIKMIGFPVLFYILLRLVPIPADIRMTMALTSAMPPDQMEIMQWEELWLLRMFSPDTSCGILDISGAWVKVLL